MTKIRLTTTNDLDVSSWATLLPDPMPDELKGCLALVILNVTKAKVESVGYVVFDDDAEYHHIYFIESKYRRKGYGKKLVEQVGKKLRLMPLDDEAESFFLHLLNEGVINKLKIDRGAEDD